LSKAHVSFNDIYEEIPIKIHNSLLVTAFLMELEEAGNMDCDFERFNLSTNPFLEKNLETLIESLDDLTAEQTKFQYWQKNVQRQQQKRLQSRVSTKIIPILLCIFIIYFQPS
jgi:translation initiation factor 3 subunit H